MKVWVRTLALALLVSTAALLSAQETATDGVRKLFEAQCAICHGLDGTPKAIAKWAPKFTDPGWIRTVEQLEKVITSGKGELMVGFKKKLTLKQIRDLAQYILSLKNGST